jgi:hypothetical protein
MGYDLRLVSWGEASGLPTTGSNLIVVGVDHNGLLRIRIFDAKGEITDMDENELPGTQSGAVSALKKQLSDLLPPHVMTGPEVAQLVSEVTSIVGQTRQVNAPRKPSPKSEIISLIGTEEISTQSNPPRLLGWYTDPSAQLEIVRVVSGNTTSYRSYTVLPWRPAIRAPMMDIELNEKDSDRIVQKLTAVNKILNEGDQKRQQSPSVGWRSTDAEHDELKTYKQKAEAEIQALGGLLYTRFLPQDFQDALLAAGNLFLELGIDEQLNAWPVELMCDAEGSYLCLRHFLGRYLVSAMDAPRRSPIRFQKTKRIVPKVLLIAVSDPESWKEYDLRLMSWGDSSGVPTSGRNLVIVGTDNNGLLHIRIFDANGKEVANKDETQLPDTQAGAISALKRRLPGLLPPHALNADEKVKLVIEVASIAGQFHWMPLSRVQQEADEIENLFKEKVENKARINVLKNEKATWDNITAELRPENKYDIVHFCGHAHFDDDVPSNSKLIIHKDDLSTIDITQNLGRSNASLYFINGCESVMGASVVSRFNLYGLGKAFLSTGAYLLGSRSGIDDLAAAAFSISFYTQLLVYNKSLGESVLRARLACRNASPYTFDWASYVFYGDPRFRFHKA